MWVLWIGILNISKLPFKYSLTSFGILNQAHNLTVNYKSKCFLILFILKVVDIGLFLIPWCYYILKDIGVIPFNLDTPIKNDKVLYFEKLIAWCNRSMYKGI